MQAGKTEPKRRDEPFVYLERRLELQGPVLPFEQRICAPGAGPKQVGAATQSGRVDAPAVITHGSPAQTGREARVERSSKLRLQSNETQGVKARPRLPPTQDLPAAPDAHAVGYERDISLAGRMSRLRVRDSSMHSNDRRLVKPVAGPALPLGTTRPGFGRHVTQAQPEIALGRQPSGSLSSAEEYSSFTILGNETSQT